MAYFTERSFFYRMAWRLVATLCFGVALTIGLTQQAWAAPPGVPHAQALTCPAGGILYVKPGGGGATDGTSWSNAFSTVQDALRVTGPCEIWVAKGVYYPDEGIGQTNNLTTSTFLLPSQVAIYGGFVSTETLRTQRDWLNNRTVLSGDIDGNDTGKDADGVVDSVTNLNGANAVHVVTTITSTVDALLDGFTINAGNAPNHPGGNGCRFDECGAGLYNQTMGYVPLAATGNLTVTNVTFVANQAWSLGGGLYNDYDSKLNLTNVLFTGNRAGFGGGMYSTFASASLLNVAFIGNWATGYGGGLLNYSSNSLLINVTFSGNRASNRGGALANLSNSAPLLVNNILWGNHASANDPQIFNSNSIPTISYSLIQDSGGSGAGWDSALGSDDGSNRDADPLFVAPIDASAAPTTTGNYQLQSGSPAINTGSNPANLTATDLVGNPRLQWGTIDLGAYESLFSTLVCPAGGVLYVKTGGAGNQSGDSWSNALPTLQDALRVVAPCQIWVAKGVYYPDEGVGRTNDSISATFRLKSGIAIYGGFSGLESSPDQRIFHMNQTVLSGDLDQNDIGKDGNGVIMGDPSISLVGANALHVVTAISVTSSARLDGFVVTAGKSPTLPGAGLFSVARGNQTLANLLVTGNLARFGGGMYYSVQSNSTLTGVTISNNQAEDGGGLYVSNSTLVLTDVSLYSNRAITDGGGIFSLGQLTLNNVSFSSNQAGRLGGGMLDYGTTAFTKGRFALNQAQSGGGLWSKGNTHLTNSTFTGNQATSMGGGVVIYAGDPMFTNVLFSGNQAAYGGGLYNNGDTLLVNATIAGNRADDIGGGIYHSSNTQLLTLVNTIVWGNAAGFDPQVSSNPETLAANYSLLQGLQPTGTANLDGTDVDNDPKFWTPIDASNAPTADGFYSLRPDSPLVDLGDDAANSTDTDLWYAPRRQGFAIDLGAYENKRILLDPTHLGIREPNGSAQFTVTLSMAPMGFMVSGVVTVTFTSSDPSECSAPASIILYDSNWAAGVAVTVSAVDDAIADGAQPCTLQTTVSSDDENFQDIPLSDVYVMVNDDETPSVTLNPTTLHVTEPDGVTVFTATLSTQPAAPVTFALNSSEPSACTVQPAVQLDASNWQHGVLVAVHAVDDAIAGGTRTCTIETSQTSSTDNAYNGLAVEEVTLTVLDNDVVGILVVPDPPVLEVSEPNDSSGYSVKLASQPIAPVVIHLVSSDPSECMVEPTMELNATNWQTGAYARVVAVDDRFADGVQNCTLTTTATSADPTYHGHEVADIAVTVADDDVVDVLVNPAGLEVSEPDGVASFVIALSSPPTATVTFQVTNSNPAECSTPATVTLEPANWQSGVAVPVHAVDDAFADGEQFCFITVTATSNDPVYNGLPSDEVEILVSDNETPGVVVNPTTLTTDKLAKSAVFTVSLTVVPTGTVTIHLQSNDTNICTVPATVILEPTNWQQGVPVTVTAVATDLQHCTISVSASSSDANYNALVGTPVGVTVPPQTVSLTVSKTGSGSGVVTSSPAGIACGGSCSFAFVQNSVVTLTATPDAGSTFGGWSGACTGAGTCQVTLDAAKSVAATFTLIPPQTVSLTVSKTGSGSGAVTSSPAGITCGTTCSASFAQNSVVTLTATPDAGSTFGGWSGACTGTGSCQVTLDAAKTVAATFTLIPPQTVSLTVSKTGSGSGAVTSSPAGITCGTTCSASFAQNSVVTLTATPDAGSTFGGWSGACTGAGTCQVTLDAAKSVAATFTLIPPQTVSLTVSKTGSGSGAVTSSPAGITCGTTCSASFAQNSVVTLTATPDAGSTFGGWSGACTGTESCQVTLDAAKTVAATFSPQNSSQTNQLFLPLVRR